MGKYLPDGPDFTLSKADEIRLDNKYSIRRVGKALEMVVKDISGIKSKCEFGVWKVIFND